MKNIQFIIAAGLVALMASCSTVRPYTATNNPIGSKTGNSETTLILGTSTGQLIQAALYSTNNDFGVIEAAKDGGINKIATVDIKTTNFFIFSKVEIIVTGE
jgi:hypothetical protein|tara:strand:- start:325 stop:630 length:306 start_codon:yes stop_codon:yes gene_type:complete